MEGVSFAQQILKTFLIGDYHPPAWVHLHVDIDGPEDGQLCIHCLPGFQHHRHHPCYHSHHHLQQCSKDLQSGEKYNKKSRALQPGLLGCDQILNTTEWQLTIDNWQLTAQNVSTNFMFHYIFSKVLNVHDIFSKVVLTLIWYFPGRSGGPFVHTGLCDQPALLLS